MPPIQLSRTDSANKDFLGLVVDLDALLRILDGEEHEFYAALNTTNTIRQVIVAYENGIAVGCGAMRPYVTGAVEIKRMFVDEVHRSKGIASAILQALEVWAKELGFEKAMLETGMRQVAAIQLYQKHGYKMIANFGKYQGVANSVCFEKLL